MNIKKGFYLIGAIVAVLVGVGGWYTINRSASQSQPITRELETLLVETVSPVAGQRISGKLVLKVRLANANNADYQVYWSVDGGQQVAMRPSAEDPYVKQADIDVTGWQWQGDGPYTLTYTVASATSDVRSQAVVPVYIDRAGPQPLQPVAPVPVAPQAVAPEVDVPEETLPAVSQLYAYPNSTLTKQMLDAARRYPRYAPALRKMAAQPIAEWFGGWNSNIRADVDTYVSAANTVNQLPVLVAYNIPQRDCGSYSAGGAADASAYASWVSEFVAGIKGRRALVIVEPDALPGADCLPAAAQNNRFAMIAQAVSQLSANPNLSIYIDAGHARWKSPADIAKRLRLSNVAAADGFSLNVSNFIASKDNVAYGNKITALLPGKHYVIDTSRNGVGHNKEWCNPSGRALGATPRLFPSGALDAYLWIKRPGESDGTCNGGPSAGTWWLDYAIGLARTAKW